MVEPSSTPPVTRHVLRATLASVPSAFARLPAGALITATVLGRDPAGHVLLRTDAAILSLAARLSLRRGSTVTLRTVRTGPGFAEGLDIGGLTGTLGFQAGGAFPVAPLDEITAGSQGNVVV